MLFINLCIFVHWTKEASALEGNNPHQMKLGIPRDSLDYPTQLLDFPGKSELHLTRVVKGSNQSMATH